MELSKNKNTRVKEIKRNSEHQQRVKVAIHDLEMFSIFTESHPIINDSKKVEKL